MIREQIAALVRQGLEAAQQSKDLPPFDIPETIPVTLGRHAAHGDYASPICLGLARVLRRAPLDIAQAVAPHIPATEMIHKVQVAPPGYLNFILDERWLAQQVPHILEAGEKWGNIDLGHRARVQVEFVSANPTGPITIGSARNAVLGDAIASILEAAGYAVEREYYVNDAGSKVRHLGESILSRYGDIFKADIPFPEQGYPGQYVTELAQAAAEAFGDTLLTLPREEAVRELTQWGVAKVLESVRDDLAALKVHFDTWQHEKEFYDSGLFDELMEKLRAGGYIVEHDDAVWFRHPSLKKDAVLIRSPRVIPNPAERPTYLASDICYLWDKLVRRGFERALYIWGADHHGDVPRVRAAAQALGLDPDRLVFLLYQLVTLRRGGKEVRMSKSSGEFVTLRDLINEIGPDPIRFMLLTRTMDVKFDFDLDLAVEQSDRNPVYYVQYAHTRIAGVLRTAKQRGFDLDHPGDPTLLTHPSELALIRRLLTLPEVIAVSANYAPHHLTTYASELASLFHAFYHECRIVSDRPEEAELSQARLMLAQATKSVLARVLHLIGVNAPERM